MTLRQSTWDTFQVPSQLEASFPLEDVSDDRYGFAVRYWIKRNMPIPTRPVVPYAVERRRHEVVVIMHAAKGAQYRMRSQSPTRRYPCKTRPSGRGRSGSRSVEPSKRVRTQSQGLNVRLGEALALAKRGEAITVPEPPKATDASVEIVSITNHEVRAGIAVELNGATDNKDEPSPLRQGQMRAFSGTHKGEYDLHVVPGEAQAAETAAQLASKHETLAKTVATIQDKRQCGREGSRRLGDIRV